MVHLIAACLTTLTRSLLFVLLVLGIVATMTAPSLALNPPIPPDGPARSTPNVTVPNVVGKKLSNAYADLQAAGFKVSQRGAQGTVRKGDPRAGTVSKINPGAGKSVPKGSTVEVWVWGETSAR